MGFRTFLGQLVFICKVKLWKVVISGKICCFSSQNVPFLCLWHFLLTQRLSNQLNFSVLCVFTRCFWWSIFPHNYQNTYGHQTFQGGDMRWHHVTNQIHISTCRRCINTTIGKVLRLLDITLWSSDQHEVTWLFEKSIFPLSWGL